MKKAALLSTLVCSLFLFACKDSGSKSAEGKDEQQAQADSLLDIVWDGHDVGMAKYGKLRSMKLKTEQMLDSISKLPAAAKEAAAPLKEKLDGLLNDLTTAKDGMDKWMSDFGKQKDSAMEDLPLRIKFLSEEIGRVNKVRDDILNGLARADSLIK